MNYSEVEKHGISAKGKKELLKHLNGEKLSYKQAVLARCYECMGFYGDGKADCGVKKCPLYHHMPYRKN